MPLPTHFPPFYGVLKCLSLHEKHGHSPYHSALCINHTIPPQIFRSRVGSLRKALKSRVEFVFVDAPFEAQVGGCGAVLGGVGLGGRPASAGALQRLNGQFTTGTA